MVGRAGEHLDLLVVEDQAVDRPDRPLERLAGDVDPQVHRVHRDEPGGPALLADGELEVGLDVREEQHVARARRVGQLRLEVLEDVEVGRDRLARVEVVAVLAAPEEGLAARDALDVVGHGAARAEDVHRLLVEVVAHGTDDPHLVEERRGEGEVGGGAAEHPFAISERSPDGVIGEGSDDGDAHRGRQGTGSGPVGSGRHARDPGHGVRRPRGAPPRRRPGAGAGRRRGRCIRVSRAGINYADTHQRRNEYLAAAQLPLIPGAEVAGVREDTGERVVALCGTGGYAEYATAPAALTVPVPDGVDDGTALALLLQGLTAWHLYRTSARVQEGESVVVHAAAGGVGSLAVQLGARDGRGPRDRDGVDGGEAGARARARRRRGRRRRARGPGRALVEANGAAASTSCSRWPAARSSSSRSRRSRRSGASSPTATPRASRTRSRPAG